MTIPEQVHEPAPLPPQRVRARSRTAGLVVGFIVVAAISVAGGWAITHQQRIADQLTVWGFDPGTVIAGYADRAALSDEGRFLFYASTPEVLANPEFGDRCSSLAEDVGILGCYQHGDRTIYLFDVTDERLDGIEEVVAAHEMLHAAWDRMSTDERDAVLPLLEAEATARADDPEFAETLDYYATAEPGERGNELHSIIGTEFDTVGPELEAYYSRYFTDRSEITALHAASHSVFEGQQDAIDDLVAQLDELEAGIDTDYADYNDGYDELNADIDDFNESAENGDFMTEAEFTDAREALLDRQDELDDLYDSIEDRTEQYDDLLAQLDDLNAQVDELNESINITPRDGDL